MRGDNPGGHLVSWWTPFASRCEQLPLSRLNQKMVRRLIDPPTLHHRRSPPLLLTRPSSISRTESACDACVLAPHPAFGHLLPRDGAAVANSVDCRGEGSAIDSIDSDAAFSTGKCHRALLRVWGQTRILGRQPPPLNPPVEGGETSFVTGHLSFGGRVLLTDDLPALVAERPPLKNWSLCFSRCCPMTA